MKVIIDYFKEIFNGVASLYKGLTVTGGYLVSPKDIVTQQYPENRATLKMYDRFKGNVSLIHDTNGAHKCTGCGICEINCPNGSIEIISKTITVEDKKKKVLDTYIYHLGMCTFCGLCIKSCPTKAIEFGQEFENSVFDRSKLTRILNNPQTKLTNDIKQ